jgi:hypothetical protein
MKRKSKLKSEAFKKGIPFNLACCNYNYFTKITISANCIVKKAYKNYMSYIRKKTNMKGGQASQLNQRSLHCPLLLELAYEKHPVY